MPSIGVFADYLDYTGRRVVVTAGDDLTAARELKRRLAELGARNISGPYDYAIPEPGWIETTPREWPGGM